MSVAVTEQTHSQLFTLRVWVENIGNGRSEIRGVLKYVLTEEIYHFRDWNTLSQLIESLIAPPQEQKSGEKS